MVTIGQCFFGDGGGEIRDASLVNIYSTFVHLRQALFDVFMMFLLHFFTFIICTLYNNNSKIIFKTFEYGLHTFTFTTYDLIQAENS